MKLFIVIQLSLLVSLFSHGKLSGVQEYSYKGIKGADQKFEIHFPKGHSKNSKAACIVFFHGGGWSRGSLNQFKNMCSYFAGRGVVSITADYTMIPRAEQNKLSKGESKKRVCVIDGKSLIRWVKINAGKLGIDKDKLVAGGASAGGHISVLSMLDKKYNNPSDDQSINTDVKAFLLFCPAFTSLKRDRSPDVNVFNNLDGKLPPFLFVVGETDNWKKASDELAKALSSKGADVQYWMGKDSGHMFHGKNGWVEECTLKADEFLVSLGLLKGKSPLKNTSGKSLTEVLIK